MKASNSGKSTHAIKSAVAPASSTAAKKKKKKPRFWTPDDDNYLREAIEKYGVDGYEAWKKVADDVPDRSYRECMQRWTKVLAPGLRKGKWDPAEDEELTALVKKQLQLLGEGGKKRIVWSQISKSFGGRSCKQCRERWINHLDPTVKKSEWTPEEDKSLLALAQLHPHKWAKIAREIPGRTENMVKVRWNALNRVKKEEANKSKRKTEKKQKPKQDINGMKGGRIHPMHSKAALLRKNDLDVYSNGQAMIMHGKGGNNPASYDCIIDERNAYIDPMASHVEPLTSHPYVNNTTYGATTQRRASTLLSSVPMWNQEEELLDPITIGIDHGPGNSQHPVDKHIEAKQMSEAENGEVPFVRSLAPKTGGIKSESLSSWPKSNRRGRRLSSKKEDIFREEEEMDDFLFEDSNLNMSFPSRKYSYTSARKMSGFALPNPKNGGDSFHALPNLNKVVTSLNGGMNVNPAHAQAHVQAHAQAFGQEPHLEPAQYMPWTEQDTDAKREREASRRESVMLWANDPKKSKNGRRRSSLLRFAPALDAQDEIPAFNHNVIPEGEMAEIEEKGSSKGVVDTEGSIRRMSNKLSQLFLMDFEIDAAGANAAQQHQQQPQATL